MQRYMEQVRRLGDEFKILLAEALDLAPTAMSHLFDEASNDRLMLAKYPVPQSLPDEDDDTVFKGLDTHKDGSFLTFLLPGTTHAGLSAQNKSGEWIPVPPLPGHLIVNIGRQLEALTMGVCKATTHRVSLHPRDYRDENGQSLGDRYSFPYFQVLGLDLTPETASLQIPTHIADLVKDVTTKTDAETFVQQYFKNGVGRGVLAARAMRHPLTAQRFYPGLLEELKAGQA